MKTTPYLRTTQVACHAESKIVPITDELDTDGTVTARLLNLADNDDKMYYALILFRPRSIGCGICTPPELEHDSFVLARRKALIATFEAMVKIEINIKDYINLEK